MEHHHQPHTDLAQPPVKTSNGTSTLPKEQTQPKPICPDGTHDWGEWRYLAKNSCTQVRVCPKCGVFESRVEHHWTTTRYRTESICVHYVCSVCGEQRVRNHQYQIHGPRSEAYICRACGYIKRRARRR